MEDSGVNDSPKRIIRVPLWLAAALAVVILAIVTGFLTSLNHEQVQVIPTQDVAEPVRLLGEVKAELDRLQQELNKRHQSLNNPNNEGVANADLESVIAVYMDSYNHLTDVYNRGAQQVIKTDSGALHKVGLPARIDKLI